MCPYLTNDFIPAADGGRIDSGGQASTRINNPNHLCLMSYHLPPGFVPTVKSHGNSKKGTPYHPTWASTKQQVKEKCDSRGPKCVVASLSAAAGDVLEATAPGQLPWGKKQIANFKAKSPVVQSSE